MGLVEALSEFLQAHQAALRDMVFDRALVNKIPESAMLMHLLQEAFPDKMQITDMVVEVSIAGQAPYRPYRSTIAVMDGQFLSAGGLMDMQDIRRKLGASTRNVLRNNLIPEDSHVQFLFEPTSGLDVQASQEAPEAWALLMQHMPRMLAHAQHDQLRHATSSAPAPHKGVRL